MLKDRALIIAPTELANYCENKGARSHAMYMGTYHFDFGKLRMTPAWHGSSIEEKGTSIYLGTPCGYVIYLGGKCVYHAGTQAFLGIWLNWQDESSRLCLASYWRKFHHGSEEALEAALMLKPKLVIPMHFNTFPVIKQDANNL